MTAMTPSVKTVQIDGETFTLKFNFGMARAAETELGIPLTSAFNAGASAMNTISAVWWAALQANHPMTREASDELIDAGGLEQVTKWVTGGLSEYFNGGNAKPGEPGKAKPKPARKPR